MPASRRDAPEQSEGSYPTGQLPLSTQPAVGMQEIGRWCILPQDSPEDIGQILAAGYRNGSAIQEGVSVAGCKIVTRKLVSFKGRNEEFTNVYYFGDGGLGLSPSEETAEDLVDAVIAAEKPIFAQSVRFLGGAVYHIGANDGPGRTPAIAVRELAATGNNGTNAAGGTLIYRELAVDIKWLLGGRRYLRSMLHTCHEHGYNTVGTTATPSSGLSAELKTFAEKMLNGPWVGDYQRIAPNGDRPTAVLYNPYLEHRQFHRYRTRNAGLLG